MLKQLLLALALCLPAGATLVTYDTDGRLNCAGGAIGCGTDTLTIGDVIMHYVPIGNATVEANPGSFTGGGFLAIGCVGGGTACGNTAMPATLRLRIQITQTSPPGVGLLPPGDIDGSVSGTASHASIAWTLPANTVIGGITYGVLNSPLGLLPPSGDNCPSPCVFEPGPFGWTSIQLFVQQRDRGGNPETPEPATLSMVGGALIGLAMWRRKRTL
jgi:hypothetical protein